MHSGDEQSALSRPSRGSPQASARSSAENLRPYSNHGLYDTPNAGSSSRLSVANAAGNRSSARFSALSDPFSDATAYSPSPSRDTFKDVKGKEGGYDEVYDPHSEEYKGYNYPPGYAVVPHATPSALTPNEENSAKSSWPSFLSRNARPQQQPTKKHKRRFQFFPSYEAPPLQHLLVHVCLCAFTYPWLLLTAFAASGRTLFYTRVLVGAGCGVIGFMLGLSLLQFARRQLMACTWATVIHESRSGEGGVRIRDLDTRTMDAASSFATIQLLISRLTNSGTKRAARKAYDKRSWTMHLLLFLILTGLTGSITFLFGRIIFIDTYSVHQFERSTDVPVFADLDAGDLQGAQDMLAVFNNFRLGWTFAPFGGAIWAAPPSVALPFREDGADESETVFFAESYPSQMRADGVALGGVAFRGKNDRMYDVWIDANADSAGNQTATKGIARSEEAVGSLVHYTQWGIRIACGLFPEPEKYIVPSAPSGSTYVLVTRSLLAPLFSRLNKSLEVDGESLLTPLNRTAEVAAEDLSAVPERLQEADGAADVLIPARFGDNGVTHTFKSLPGNNGDSGTGWTQLELTLVRLDSSFAPNGSFPLFAPLTTAPGEPASPGGQIGIDAAICIETFEPWVVEVFNATGGGQLVTRRIVGKGFSVNNDGTGGDATAEEEIRIEVESVDKDGLKVVEAMNVGKGITSNGRFTAFQDAHQNAVNQMLKDNAQDARYVPSPTVISFTNGTGPSGYTKLDPSILGAVRASSDSTNLLSFLAGSRPLLAKQFPDEIRADASVSVLFAAAIIALVLLVGVAAGLFVPKLPRSQDGAEVPQRGFGLYAWLAVLQGDGVWQQVERELRSDESQLQPLMSEEEVNERLGEMRIRYAP